MEFSRLEILIGSDIEKIKNLSVLILGVGGVGGYVAESIARCGVLNITIVDYDTIDITNINRQIIALHSTIGKKKVEVLKNRILDINPNCKVKTLDLFYGIDNKDILFESHIDYVFDCCDSIKSKELVIRESIKRNIKIISSMGAGFKFDPSKIKITKLKNTSYDKIAKILRYNLKDSKECLDIPVVISTEVNNIKSDVIGSNSYIPSIFGLYMTSFFINDVVGKYE